MKQTKFLIEQSDLWFTTVEKTYRAIYIAKYILKDTTHDKMKIISSNYEPKHYLSQNNTSLTNKSER